MQLQNPNKTIVLGRFGKPFGVFGWIKVISFTDPLEKILNFKPWLIKKDHLWREVYLDDSKVHAAGIVVKIPGFDTPESVSDLTNSEIVVPRESLPNLKDSEYYWADLIGLKVINKENVELGEVFDLMATGSNDVLVVNGKKRRLIPYISTVITKVDLDSRIIYVDWPEDF